jgi:2,3-bisphosphoglycerate-dependent phosphoglycerate mutase
LYFVRHAHSIYTPEELKRPLSKKGFSDVEKINQLLFKESIDIVISSPYLRAVQTVEGVAAVCSYEDVSIKELILNTFGQVGNNN